MPAITRIETAVNKPAFDAHANHRSKSMQWIYACLQRRTKPKSGCKSELQAHQQQKLYIAHLSHYLHEPAKEISKILRRNRSYLARIELFRNQQQSIRRLQSHRQSFVMPLQQQYRSLLQHDKRSRLLVSYHYGDFVYGGNVLAGCEDLARRQYFLTQAKPSRGFSSNMSRCFGLDQMSRRSQLLVEGSEAREFASLLRAGNTTFLTFADLPAGFGESTRVRFLGRQAWFPKGPATLAMIARVPIVPVINVSDRSGNQVQLHPQIEPVLLEGETLALAIDRITQLLVKVLEHAVISCPWQWRFLTSLPVYFCDKDVVG